MKTVRDLMRREVITLRPDASVAAAIQAILRHRIGGLPVVEGDAVVGIVTPRDLLGQALYRLVGDIMTTDVATVSPDAPVTAAYRIMEERQVGRLPVVEDGRLAGIIARVDVLQELGKLTDPLTDLPWPGTLRQRAADLLRAGQEIVVAFIDLDGFRLVNKRHGHVVGDRCIVAVADLLRRLTDPAADLVTRYGGDEFAIVTTRRLESAEALAERLVEAIAALEVDGVRGLTASVGLAGGRRAGERAEVHPPATADDLITLASRASTTAKQLDRRILHAREMEAMRLAEAPAPVEVTRLRLLGVHLTVEAARAAATVELGRDAERFRGEAEGAPVGNGPLRAMAQATVNALAALLPEGWRLAIEEIAFTAFPAGDAVSVALALATPSAEELLVGTAPYDRHHPDAVIRATLKAVNRRLGRLLATA